MNYEKIQLNVSNDPIRNYKIFEGIKLYSELLKSEDGKTLTNKRIFITKKKNYVYYQRTDVNWNYWSEKKQDRCFDINDVKHNIVFEISTDLNDFAKYLNAAIIKKILLKEQNGDLMEVLDI